MVAGLVSLQKSFDFSLNMNVYVCMVEIEALKCIFLRVSFKQLYQLLREIEAKLRVMREVKTL